MDFKLTKKYQFSKRSKLDGKSRNYLTYFLNGIEILKQKVPFDESLERGFDRRTAIRNEYIMNGKMYQTRISDVWCGKDNSKNKTREVYFPISKKRLSEMGVPLNLKIEMYKNETE
jgi:hypothetical protein